MSHIINAQPVKILTESELKEYVTNTLVRFRHDLESDIEPGEPADEAIYCALYDLADLFGLDESQTIAVLGITGLNVLGAGVSITPLGEATARAAEALEAVVEHNSTRPIIDAAPARSNGATAHQNVCAQTIEAVRK